MNWQVMSYRTAIVGALMAGLVLPAEYAQARKARFGIPAIGIIPGVVLTLPNQRRPQAKTTKRDKRTPKDERPDEDTSTVLAHGTTNAVFKGIIVSKGLSSVGVEDSIDTARQDMDREKARDYSSAIEQILATIRDAMASTARNGIATLSQGDVTKHALDQAVTQTYQDARLATFEQFLGEQWTNERLRVAIVMLANTKMPELLDGNNFKRVEMKTLSEIIDKAGRDVYKRTLEMSELIAMNQATGRFMRVMFETHGSVQTDDQSVVMEDILHAGSTEAFKDYVERFQRSDLGVVMRYRAERVLMDCLTANVDKLVEGDSKKLSKQTAIAKIKELANGECRNWIVKAIGEPKPGTAQEDEKILQPLPVRAVWVDGEAKTDASMFGRASRL